MSGLAQRLDAPVGAAAAAAILGAMTNPLVYFQFRADGSAAAAARRLSHTVVAALGFDADDDERRDDDHRGPFDPASRTACLSGGSSDGAAAPGERRGA